MKRRHHKAAKRRQAIRMIKGKPLCLLFKRGRFADRRVRFDDYSLAA